MIRSGLVALLVTSALSLTACRQGPGDRCQLNSDCQDNLLCALPVGGTPQSGGTCQANGLLDMTSTADFLSAPDLLPATPDLSATSTDASSDGSQPTDFASSDL